MERQRSKPTDIEDIMREGLERHKIKGFEPQFPTHSGFIIDFAFPQIKLAIECDGERWHSSKKAKAKKRFRDWILRRSGWRIIHFDGKEIHADIDFCIRRIIDVIN